ncbi:MAG: hypothetical protein R6W68_03045 [Ignavibacteriaceae bacterium]
MLSKLCCTILLSLISSFIYCQPSSSNLIRDFGYPKWLKSGEYRTDQTSGIVFLNSEEGKKNFLLADDIGLIHRLVVFDDCIYKFYPVHLSSEVKEYFKDYPKLDFEEIVYDRYTDKFYISIEGHTENYEQYVGIFEIVFNNTFDTVLTVTKINFQPEALFLKYTAWNIGYEGLTVDSRYFYLGLEGFLNGKAFSDSTVIFIADKHTKEIIKEINTKPMGIGSIAGLFSDKDYSVWLLDRNNLKIFKLEFDENFNVSSQISYNFEPVIPGYTHLNYAGSYESITIDDEGNIYIVDDPWRQFFVPPDNVLSELDSVTIKNFKDNIPVIDRFQIK